MIDSTAAVGQPAASAPNAPASRSSRFLTWASRELAPGQLARLGLVTLQAGLLVGVLRKWNLESQALENVAMLALAGFLVHHFLPLRFRLPLFALLSVGSIVMVFGVRQGAFILFVGTGLIALCHIPVRAGVRVALVVGAGVVLAIARWAPEWTPPGFRAFFPASIWPILGSMFMFRLMLYIYEVKHRSAPTGPWRAAGYFFMLPNVCLPLFPVVDYQTFTRNHYNDDPIRIYQTGVKWILRGFVQLLIYRFVYLYCMIDVSDVHNVLGVGRYMLTTFLLYLKISGLFHTVVGFLHLFGFNLPETHHLYLLSSSFTDFWRRINIYWKDFITKLVFYPLYFGWRKLGESRAVVLATLGAFLATWILHSYQWFWIRGTFPIVWSDLVFWFGLGLVVVLNVRWEQRRGRSRTLKKASRTVGSELGLAVRTAGTFTSICILWTIWSTPQLEDVRLLLRAATKASALQILTIACVPLGIGLLAIPLGRKAREHTEGTRARTVKKVEGFWSSAFRTAAFGAALLLVGTNPRLLSFRPELVPVALELRNRGLNKADQEALHRGYYEELGDVTRFDNELWRLYGLAPKNWGHEMEIMQVRNDRILYSYRPGLNGIFQGVSFSTNSAGMRDREYATTKPPGTFRIALIGASHDAGSGVPDGQLYESVIENRLNEKWGDAEHRYEVLNFSANGYGPLQKLAVSEMLVPAYSPDVVLYAASLNELTWTFLKTEDLMRRGMVDEYPFLVQALRSAGIDPHGDPPPQVVLERKLAPQAREILGAILQRFATGVRNAGAHPGLVLVELPEDDRRPASFDVLAGLGRAARCDVFDLYGVYAGIADRSKLWIQPWDDHTNALGHRLLGEKLLDELVEKGIVPVGDTP